MSESIYQKLQEYLNQLPSGFPKTESGVEIDLLKTMYEPDEATIALHLTPTPASATEIAAKMERDADTMTSALDRMAERGLLFMTTLDGQRHYVLMPYIVGTFEFQLNRLAPDYNKAHNRYLADAMGFEVFGGKTSQFRIMPVEKSLENIQAIMPHEKIREAIDKAEIIVANDCLCRKKAELEGRGCDHPLRVCLALNEFGRFYLETGMPGEVVSRAQAHEIMNECEKLGLIPHTQNAQEDISYICNCCTCSCGIFSTVVKLDLHSQVVRSSWQNSVDSVLCSGCGTCEERCPFKAMTLGSDEKAVVNKRKCMGCGLCISTCPEQALTLTERAEAFMPDVPVDTQEMYDRIQAEKERPLRMLSLKNMKAKNYNP